MPIYEYYSPDSNKIYSFYAKTVAQGQTIPKCPDNPSYRMVKIMSSFAITGGERKNVDDSSVKTDDSSGSALVDDPRMDAAMAMMEKEMAGVDENDPRAMGRFMRRMSELTGEKLDAEAEEVVRKLEEGADPEELEEQMGNLGDEASGSGGAPPSRDPNLYDY